MSESRTLSQNSAIHKLFTQYAEKLNDAGFDQMAVLEQKVCPSPNTPESIKGLWRLIQGAMYPPEDGDVSTTRLTTEQVNKVYIVLDKFLGEHFGITVPFPSDEPPMIGEKHE